VGQQLLHWSRRLRNKALLPGFWLALALPEWRWRCAWPDWPRFRPTAGPGIAGHCYTCAAGENENESLTPIRNQSITIQLPSDSRNYATKPEAATPPAQIKRNVAAEITSVGKVIYETGWDANKPTDKPKVQKPSSSSSQQPAQGAPEDEKRKELDTVKSKRDQMRDNMQDYIFTRYFNYVKNYDKVLEKNFPKAMQLYRVFFDGVKDFFGDMKRFLKIARIANDSPQGIRALNRQELELYMQMPRDMMKVAPALIGCSLPMVGYAFFPLV